MMDGAGVMVHRGHGLAEREPSRRRAMLFEPRVIGITSPRDARESAEGGIFVIFNFFWCKVRSLMFFLSGGMIAGRKKSVP